MHKGCPVHKALVHFLLVQPHVLATTGRQICRIDCVKGRIIFEVVFPGKNHRIDQYQLLEASLLAGTDIGREVAAQ